MFRLNNTFTHAALSLISLSALAFAATGHAEQTAGGQTPTVRKASFIPPGATDNRPSLEGVSRGLPAGSDNILVFSAPPRETEAEGVRTYQPIAEYLSHIIGKTIVYKHPSDWLTYQTEMQRGSYDLVFDGPHFNSWRISKLQHSTLVKIAGEHAFAVVVRKDDTRTMDLKQLAGQRVCGMDPPNLGTLAILGQFDNPARQPLIVNNLGWTKAYEGVALEKRCNAAILPIESLKRFQNSDNLVRVVYRTKPLPNQAFSAGPRISSDDKARIATALMSPDGAAVTAALRATYGSGKGLAFASKEDYAGLDAYLKDTWGYSR